MNKHKEQLLKHKIKNLKENNLIIGEALKKHWLTSINEFYEMVNCSLYELLTEEILEVSENKEVELEENYLGKYKTFQRTIQLTDLPENKIKIIPLCYFCFPSNALGSIHMVNNSYCKNKFLYTDLAEHTTFEFAKPTNIYAWKWVENEGNLTQVNEDLLFKIITKSLGI